MNTLQNIWNNKSYLVTDNNTIVINQIICSFGVKVGHIDDKVILKDLISTSKYQNYKHYKLPITMDPLYYGKLIYLEKSTNTHIVQVTPRTLAHVTPDALGVMNQVEIFKDGEMILNYKDRFVNGNKSFIITLGKNTFRYSSEGELELVQINKPTRFINKVASNPTINTKIVT